MNGPCVSVIVTNYNYGKFLERCILSILNQDYKNIELPDFDKCIIYLDPPYRNTKEYETKFNFEEFDEYVL